MAPRPADERLRIHPGAFGAHHLVIQLLRIDIGKRRPDRRNLVTPDTTIDKILCALNTIQVPLSIILHDRDRQRPVIFADGQHHVAERIGRDRVLNVVGGDEFLARLPVRNRVTGKQERNAARSKYIVHSGHVIDARRGNESLTLPPPASRNVLPELA